jgi:hypothetical protein
MSVTLDARAEPTHRRNSAARSIEPLRWLYTVAAGFALTTAVQNLVVAGGHGDRVAHDSRILLFAVFMSFLIRFVHGALRAFDMTYQEGTLPGGVRPIVDFVGLFAEAVLFILLALALNDHSEFATYLLALVLADLVWLALIRAGGPGPVPFRNWLVADVLFLAVWIPVFALHRSSSVWVTGAIFGVTVVHTVLDYVLPQSWEFYFETAPPPFIARVQRQLPGWLRPGSK